MGVTSITVGWTETVSLGNYNNAKPTLTRTVAIGPGEDAAVLEAWHRADVKRIVQEEADAALEAHNIPARYSSDPRFDVRSLTYGSTRYLIITPQGVPFGDKHTDAHQTWVAAHGYRIAHARRFAVETYEGGTVFDCADGDFSALIPILDAAKAAEEQRQLAYQQQLAKKRDEERAERERRYGTAPLATERDPFADGDDDESDDEE